MQTVEVDFEQKEQEIMGLQKRINEKGNEINENRIISDKLKREIDKLQSASDNYREQYHSGLLELEEFHEKLHQREEEHLGELIDSGDKIDRLEKNLLDKRNELAIQKEMQGEPAIISSEALEVLEQEYEPRFDTLYKESVFNPEFFRDFFTLIPSDRLRVEASIVNLNYNYDLHTPKVRPHSVKTRGGSLNEYPFGRDRVGRIYFNKDKGKVNFYRISRTKSGRGKLDQKRVIAWLKVNR